MEPSNRKRAILGIVLVVIGSIFLLDNLGFDIDLPWYIFRWPIIFIILGVVNLLSGNLRPAFIFFGLGTLFYLHIFDVFELRHAWPIILIIVGISFIIRKGSGKSNSSGNSELNFFDEIAILGGTDKTFTSQNLQGGKVTSLFGGSKIDLREANPQEGGASIDLFCMFGGTEIYVPDDWEVNMEATAILGGFSDERKNITPDASKKLHIKGFVMFGGGELKN